MVTFTCLHRIVLYRRYKATPPYAMKASGFVKVATLLPIKVNEIVPLPHSQQRAAIAALLLISTLAVFLKECENSSYRIAVILYI